MCFGVTRSRLSLKSFLERILNCQGKEAIRSAVVVLLEAQVGQDIRTAIAVRAFILCGQPEALTLLPCQVSGCAQGLSEQTVAFRIFGRKLYCFGEIPHRVAEIFPLPQD